MQGSYKTKKEEEENEWKKRHKSQKRERKKRVGVFGQRGSANSLLRQSEKPLPGLLLVWEWGGGKTREEHEQKRSSGQRKVTK